MSNEMQGEPLRFGVAIWDEDGGMVEALARVERTDSDEVSLVIQRVDAVEVPTIYLSLAASEEAAKQVLARAREEWEGSEA